MCMHTHTHTFAHMHMHTCTCSHMRACAYAHSSNKKKQQPGSACPGLLWGLIVSIVYCGVTSGASVRVFLERYNWGRPIMHVGGTIP